MKRSTLLTILFGGGGVILTLFFAGTEKSRSSQADFEQQPPIPMALSVQKLTDTTTDGHTMAIKIQYVSDSTLPSQIQLYRGGVVYTTLRDDGQFPDDTAGDFKYAALVKEHIPTFLAAIQKLDSIMVADSAVQHFRGHSAKRIGLEQIERFDFVKFNFNEETGLSIHYFDIAQCDNEIKKDHSLFITDPSVVEHPSLTYNVVTKQGNPSGAWTFGTLMRNICNSSYTGISEKEFLKQWVARGRPDDIIDINDLSEASYINGFFYISRFVIPWITHARRATNSQYQFPLNGNWKDEWDATAVEDLYNYAPFKLTAIVNRIDLHGNILFNSSIHNAGETRFIFTYICPYEFNVDGTSPEGEAPLHHFPDFNGGLFLVPHDWRGINVIFEYQNVQTTFCDLQTFAYNWASLSSLQLGGTDYINVLSTLTNSVTIKNAAPHKTGNNKSAIGRIRTNEKVFSPAGNSQNNNVDWEDANWQFRQYEIDPNTHCFERALLENTPDGMLNFSQNVRLNGSIAGYTPGSPLPNRVLTPQSQEGLFKWMFNSEINLQRILHENHTMPSVFVSNSTSYDLRTHYIANVLGEAGHYLAFDPTLYSDYIENFFTTKYGSTYQLTTNDRQFAKELRHKVSLNTCQGCHSGDTKTMFTHMGTIGYGTPASYLNTVPDKVNSTSPGSYITNIDIRDLTEFNQNFFYSIVSGLRGNRGKTLHNNVAVNNFHIDFPTGYPVQIVSPFLTGRVYHGNGDYSDDRIASYDDIPSSNESDYFTNGSFFVNDPSNTFSFGAGNTPNHGDFPALSDVQWGFNDLERRKKHLCILLKRNCTITDLGNGNSTTLDLLGNMLHIPFAIGAH